MNVAVDTDRCIGAGQCAAVVPQVFDQSEDDGTVVLRVESPPPELASSVHQAAMLCPSQAITVADEA